MVGFAPSRNAFFSSRLLMIGRLPSIRRLEGGEHGGIGRRLGPVPHEAIGAEEPVDLLIVEDEPAQRFQLFLLAHRQEPAGALGEIGEDHAGLRELSHRAPARALRPSR